MVRVDTHIVIFEVKGILAELHMLEFIFVKVGPAPQSCINDMRKTFPSCHLMRKRHREREREHSIITTGALSSILFSRQTDSGTFLKNVLSVEE